MNTENAQVVYDYFIMNPGKHSQDDWVADSDGSMPVASKVAADENFCGTTMCVAGAAAWLLLPHDEFSELVRKSNQRVNAFEYSEHWEEIGAALLGLNSKEREALFYQMDDDVALDMLNAVANGDSTKFWALSDKADNED